MFVESTKQCKCDLVKPRVSVIIPAYSRPHYLSECLCSIRSQTMASWECIVVDDNSPLGERITKAVSQCNDDRFHYIRRPANGGPAAARNTGVRLARAELFVCVDEDDRLVPEALEVLVHECEKFGVDAVCPQGRFFGGMSGQRRAVMPTLELLLQGMCVLPNGWIVRKKLWEKVGGYDEDQRLIGRDDWEIWLRFLKSEAQVKVIDDILYEIRVPAGGIGEPGSLEHEVQAREVSAIQYVIQKHAALYSQYPHARVRRLARAIRKERDYYTKVEQFMVAALRSFELFLLTHSVTDLAKTGSLLATAMIGKKATDIAHGLLRKHLLHRLKSLRSGTSIIA